MHHKSKLIGLALLATTVLNASIVFDSNVASDLTFSNNLATIANFTPTTATDALLIVAFAGDGTNLRLGEATFGGETMTLLNADVRTQIFAYKLTDTVARDLVIGVSAPNNIFVYGTLRGVDTSVALSSYANAGGATASGSTLTLNAPLTVNAGDYVLSMFNNNFNASTYYTGSTHNGGLNPLIFTSENSFTAGIYGGTAAAGGSFTPQVTWTGGTGTNAEAYGSAVAFTAIPEPGTLALVGVALGSLLLFRRRR